MDLRELVEFLLATGDAEATMRNVRAQFGRAPKRYLGAELLPEREVDQNEYTETDVRYRTTIANDGTRYSPAQLKDSGLLVGSVEVRLWSKDIAREFTSRDLDAVQRLLNRGMDTEAAIRFLDWFDQMVNVALIEKDEVQRWEAIVNAQVLRKGDNGFAQTMYYPNPAGHRAAAGDVWSDPTYDPYEDIIAGADFLRTKGYRVNRIVWPSPVRSKFANNPNVIARAGNGPIVIGAGGTVQQVPPARASNAALAGMFAADELPAPETYDETYNTQVGQGFFLPRDVCVLLATTGRDEEILPVGDEESILLQNTLGYTGVGRAAGQAEPGRAFYLEAFTNKPPRIEAEGWVETAPVILDPEAIFVIKSIS